MALIICPECNKEISSEAKVCPHCGYKQKRNMNIPKKYYFIGGVALAVIVVAIIITVICVKVSNNKKQEELEQFFQEAQEEEQKKEAENKAIQDARNKDNPVEVGQTITSSDEEVTITGYDIVGDLMPPDTSGYYTYYSADVGKKYLDIQVTIKNLAGSSQKQDGIVNNPTVEIAGKYTYNLHAVTEEAGRLQQYTNLYAIQPLETKKYHFAVQVPDEITGGENSITFKFRIDNKSYVCYLR